MSEALVIAAVSASAYMIALAYRAGTMWYFGLPITLATVSLSDAAFAGLFVLLGIAAVLLVVDPIESRAPGAIERVASTTMSVGAWASVLAIPALILAAAFSVAGNASPFVVFGAAALLIGAWLGGVLVARWLMRAARYEMLARVAKRYPKTAAVTFLAVFLFAFSFYLGGTGFNFLGRGYARTGSEVAVAISEDRAVLAEAESSDGEVAVLTGAFRVVPLPSEDTTFSGERVDVKSARSTH